MVGYVVSTWHRSWGGDLHYVEYFLKSNCLSNMFDNMNAMYKSLV